jgi:prevent-host-death family protein
METINVTQAKAHLSRLLERVARGETVLVVRRGRVIARIEPAGTGSEGAGASVLDALQREGVLRRPAKRPDPKVLRGRKPPMPRGKGLLDALLSEREEGR